MCTTIRRRKNFTPVSGLSSSRARKATGSSSPSSCCERTTVDPLLQKAIESLAVPGVLIGHRVIQPGDEKVLLRDRSDNRHLAGAGKTPRQRRRAHRRARAAETAWRAGAAIPKRVSGAPLWPEGVTGSFAHDHLVAVAAAGLTRNVGAVGIDVEPATLLPDDMFDLVTHAERTDRDRRRSPARPRVLRGQGSGLQGRAPARRDYFSTITTSRSIWPAAEPSRRPGHARHPVLLSTTRRGGDRGQRCSQRTSCRCAQGTGSMHRKPSIARLRAARASPDMRAVKPF